LLIAEVNVSIMAEAGAGSTSLVSCGRSEAGGEGAGG